MHTVKSQMKIAIVGVAAQIPSGDFSTNDLGYRAFWDFLAAQGQAYQRLNADHFASSGFKALQKALDLPAKGAFLKNHDGMDSTAFGISIKDARIMPFAARRLMELSFEALADSGVNYRHQKVGCFITGSGNFEVSGAMSTNGSFASIPSAPANRISYMLDILGPSVQLDTACSSSLTGLHLAIQAIEAGDCHTALVGAAQINRELVQWKNYSLSGVLSSDGITKPFDAGADGFGRGEGVTVVVIKPLDDALQDGDQIYSVILGSCINSTGSMMPLHVPSGVAQKECILGAYARAGKRPSDADFAELHITGTSVGDRIETTAAGEVFTQNLDVGTVKGNIGHLEAAAFLASLLKACLILEKKSIPATVNFSVPSPDIQWNQHGLSVPTEMKSLGCRSDSGQSLISLSSAGIGGSTGHVVIQSPPARGRHHALPCGGTSVTFLIGGLSSKAVAQISQRIRDDCPCAIDTMRACAVTMSRRARQMPWRTYFTLGSSVPIEIPAATLVPPSPPPIAFIFSGQGPQNLDMGRVLFRVFPAFRSTILELDEVYKRVVGESLLESTGLFVTEPSCPPLSLSLSGWPVTVTVAAIAMLQMALFDLLTSAGVSPSSLAGHSAGETAILYASGASSKAMALEIAIARGQAMTVTESVDTGMASLGCSADVAKQLISRLSGNLEISCFNSPNSVAISGSADLLTQAISLAQTQGIFAQRIRTMVPGHSSYMDKIKEDYMARMIDIFTRYPGQHIPKVPVFSTCTGQARVDEFSPSYFWDNCRNPVLFSAAITTLLDFHGDTARPIFLEISCHPVLSSLICSHNVPTKSVLCPMRRCARGEADFDEATQFVQLLAQVTLLGYNSCEFSGVYGFSDYKQPFMDHPWVYRPIPGPLTHFSHVAPHPPANGSLSTSFSLNERTHPLLAEHVIDGQPILPATGVIEILLQAGASILWDVEFLSFLSLSARDSAQVVLERSGCEWSLTSTNPHGSVERQHARGLMDNSMPTPSPTMQDLQAVWNRLPKLEIKGFYESLHGFEFGSAYRRVVRCHGNSAEAIAQIGGLSSDEPATQYRLNPILLDACLHIMLHPAISKCYGAESMYLPCSLGRFTHHNRSTLTGDWFSHIRRRKWSPDTKSYDIVVTDQSGAAICEFYNLQVRRPAVQAPFIRRRLDLIFQPVSLHTTAINSASYSYRERQSDEAVLYAILDSLAVHMISKSLQKNIVVGGDVSRRRYFDFAKSSLRKNTSGISSSIANEMRTKYPFHFEVTRRIADLHESVFLTSKPAIDALYSDDLMSRFYSSNSETSTIYPEAARTFSSLIDSLQAGGKQALNILEVGAGTGLLTRYLVEVLQRKPHLLAEYTVTDTSYALVTELACTLPYHKITPNIYNLAKDPSRQGLRLESYDVVVALHVLHAVPDIQFCLSSLQSLLVPGGTLLVIEFDGTSWDEKPGSVWLDCVFGSFPEWFGFEDGRTHCTMPPQTWMNTLQDLGFVNGHASIDGGQNFLFTAQRPNLGDHPILLDHDAGINSLHILEYSVGKEMELRARLDNIVQIDHLQLYVVVLEGRDADSAMGLCATLAREFPFWTLSLAIFECPIHLSQGHQRIVRHRGLFERGESVVYFPREETPRVLRVVPSPPPTTILASHPLVLGDPDHLVVNIISSDATTAAVFGFVGRVAASHHQSYVTGDTVVGITNQKKASSLVVHLGCIASWPPGHQPPVPADVLKLGVTALIRDCLPTRRGRDSRCTRVLVATNDDFMVGVLTKTSGTILVQCDFRDDDPSRSVDVLITDSDTSSRYPHLRHSVPRSGRFIVWDTILCESISTRTWDIAHMLDLCVPELVAASDLHGYSHPEISVSTPNEFYSPLFRHDKSYIILGGIGGLGVDLAVWMYQHGARHVVLTSRRGIASLDPEKDIEALSKIAYLHGCHQLELQLVKSDATNESDLSLLTTGLQFPIAGCFQLTLVLSDLLFVNQTQETFAAPHEAKLKVFETFAATVDVESLDFYVAFSSFSGLLGLAGQSNYASACTLLEGVLARYPRAFSLVVPTITDAGYLERTRSESVDDRIFLASMSSSDLMNCLEDGLRKLRDGPPFSRYIPDLDWDSLHAQYPLPPSFHHLLSSHQQSTRPKMTDIKAEEDVLKIVLSVLEVEKDDFEFDRPLLSYGLDSLSATRLSAALQSFVQVSQVQLLAGVSWSELQPSLRHTDGRDQSTEAAANHRAAQEIFRNMLGVEERDFDKNTPLSSYGLDSLSASKLAAALRTHLPDVTQLQLMGRATWADLVALKPTPNMSLDMDRSIPTPPTEIILEICNGPGTPLIVFPGAAGGIDPLLVLRSHFSGALFGVQVTDSTPIAPFMAHAVFVVQKICERWPTGPYRLASFSGSSIMAVAVAKLLEESGQEVVQLAFIDGFPFLWLLEDTETFLRTQELPAIVDKGVASIIDLLRHDPLYGAESEQVSQWETAFAGRQEATQTHLATVTATRRIMSPLIQFLLDFYGTDTRRSYDQFATSLSRWVSPLRAPFSVFIAEFGAIATLPDSARETWADLGAHICSSDREVRQHLIRGAGHFGILGAEETAALLQSF
ncbi:Polyketide synthase [Mycena sanguinolenta]|uniref:Polyketide synthase n=1 Tax=Mycena sanguinolenta TaxID=230812 RepID=A0A8H6Z5J4_9AGAR|nr:Polyketide synthase [Mycena sanguinolenta]